MPHLTEREKIELLMMVGYGDRLRTHAEACDLFNQEHPDRPPIARSTVSKLVVKFIENGNVKDLPRSGRPRISDEIKLNVILEAEENPHASTRQLALDNNVDQSSVVKLFRQEKYHPYKVQLINELNEDDPDRRLEFCEELMLRCDQNPQFLNNIIFSDEATFCLNGHVHRHNCRYWSRENPHWTQTHHSQRQGKLNVWVGIVRQRFLGPFFFEGNLTGDRYLDFLRLELVPALAVLFPNDENNDVPHQDIWFQQDGAPPHFAVRVRQYLDETFPEKWIGRRGPFEWPARSPDLTPLDFFLWGYLKSRVYFNRPENLEDLRQRIRDEMAQISQHTIERSVQSVYTRAGQCQMVGGGQFEHIR